jgi:sugar O-acyltransferase (sialic acid O-acetyltransferase NeuD family)
VKASQDLVILGAGGNSLSIIDAVESRNLHAAQPQFRIRGILDDLPENRGGNLAGYPVLGTIDQADRQKDCLFINGISSVSSFRQRREIVRRASLSGAGFATVIHPGASVSPRASIGAGCAILAGVVVGSGARLEPHVLVLENSTIDHHARLEPHVTLSAGVTVLGSVQVGESAFIGGGSSIAPYVRIGAGALVGMGAVVIRDVRGGAVVAGNPARELAESSFRAPSV